MFRTKRKIAVKSIPAKIVSPVTFVLMTGVMSVNQRRLINAQKTGRDGKVLLEYVTKFFN